MSISGPPSGALHPAVTLPAHPGPLPPCQAPPTATLGQWQSGATGPAAPTLRSGHLFSHQQMGSMFSGRTIPHHLLQGGSWQHWWKGKQALAPGGLETKAPSGGHSCVYYKMLPSSLIVSNPICKLIIKIPHNSCRRRARQASPAAVPGCTPRVQIPPANPTLFSLTNT